jgi:hypothetical protein
MDAVKLEREEEVNGLLRRLSELLIEEQREQGVYQQTPHLCDLECASLALGQRLSRVSLARAVREVAAESDAQAACPTCGAECLLTTSTRTVKSVSGSIDVVEPMGSCPTCRRSFFPSA